jgi:indolepyruvate ferredoxin oxidoreductase beta subunit
MKCDVILVGVGGQGVLSLASILAAAALREGLHVKQSEVHGMAQRGGDVSAHLRLSDRTIRSGLVSEGRADLVLAMEPVEALRWCGWLAPSGVIVSSTNPVRNVSEYPDLDGVLERLRLRPGTVLVDAMDLARRAGAVKAANAVLVGAASPLLPVRPETIETLLRETFTSKGESVVDANLRAFRLGREAHACVSAR